MAATKDQQVPWDSSSLTAPFFFKPAQFSTASQPVAAPVTKPAAAGSGDTQLEVAFWNSIQNSTQAGDYQEYLNRFPDGTFAGLAKNRLAALDPGAARQQPATPEVQQPAAAPIAASVTTSEPVVEPVATEPVAANDGILRDSRGLDCRIRDATRSESECRGVKRAGGGGGGYSTGGKSTGSTRWQ
jgi:carboxyl-terminal processing protease